MTSEQMDTAFISPEKGVPISPEEQTEINKRKLFEDYLQACYALRKAKIAMEDVLPGSSKQERFMRHVAHPAVSDAFRGWFEQLEKSGDPLIPNYLASHTEDEIMDMKDMDEILAVLESSRHHRLLH